jgi:hypothetical protein
MFGWIPWNGTLGAPQHHHVISKKSRCKVDCYRNRYLDRQYRSFVDWIIIHRKKIIENRPAINPKPAILTYLRLALSGRW